MNKYTVLLLVPDYLAENYGEETFQTWVESKAPAGAAREARMQARDALDIGGDMWDFLVLAVYEGWIHDVKP